jgi:hypothetical protein
MEGWVRNQCMLKEMWMHAVLSMQSSSVKNDANLLVIAVVFNSLQTGTSQSEESGNNAKRQKCFNGNRLNKETSGKG